MLKHHLPVIGIAVALCLFVVAASSYPGGTTDSASTVGYSWSHNWPFGPRWSWDYVPVAEATLTESGEEPTWKASLPKPQIRTGEIEALVAEEHNDAVEDYRLGAQRAVEER